MATHCHSRHTGGNQKKVSGEPYDDGMGTLTALDARTTAIEYAVFEQFPHTMEAMRHPLTQTHAVGVENAQAIAGLRVDMAALQTSLHRDVTDLKAALDLQGDSLRNELVAATAEFRTSLTGVREEMSLRFQKVDGQFNGVNCDIANLQSDVTTLKENVTTLKENGTTLKENVTTLKENVNRRFDTVDAKLETLVEEIRNGKN